MSNILKGAPVAAALDEKTSAAVTALLERGVVPKLAILRVGERADDMSYEKGAMKRCEKVGVAVQRVVLPENVSQDDLMRAIDALNRDGSVHGVLMFRPLPKTLDEGKACAALAPAKDVDGVTSGSMARVYSGSGAGFAPCTAQSVMELLKFYGVPIAGKRAAVVGRSLVIGRPAAMLLMAENATVTVCHTKTTDTPSVTRKADIVVAAAGRAESIGPEYLREGQIVVDVGINWSEEKQRLVGDVDFERACGLVEGISPVPSGVGSVTTAVLVSHVAEAAGRTIK